METGKQKWIDKAQTQTEKLTELVNSLVTLSRMDEEKTPLHFAPFAVSDAVRETAESSGTLPNRTGMRSGWKLRRSWRFPATNMRFGSWCRFCWTMW